MFVLHNFMHKVILSTSVCTNSIHLFISKGLGERWKGSWSKAWILESFKWSEVCPQLNRGHTYMSMYCNILCISYIRRHVPSTLESKDGLCWDLAILLFYIERYFNIFMWKVLIPHYFCMCIERYGSACTRPSRGQVCWLHSEHAISSRVWFMDVTGSSSTLLDPTLLVCDIYRI